MHSWLVIYQADLWVSVVCGIAGKIFIQLNESTTSKGREMQDTPLENTLVFG